MVVERDYTSYGNYFVAICCLLSKTSSVSLLQWDEINSEVAFPIFMHLCFHEKYI